MKYSIVAREVVRRLRENDDRGDAASLRRLAAEVIEQLLEQGEAQSRIISKLREAR